MSTVTAAAFVPSAPFLLPGLGGGPDELRTAIDQALAALAGPVTVLGAAPVDGPVAGTADATPWGAPGLPAPDPLPLPLAVGCTLLGDRPHTHAGAAGGPVMLTGSVLVVGDGSARRTEKAPGHFDARAEGFDVLLDDALAAGDPAALLALDADLAAALLVSGLAAWQALARQASTQEWRADLLWSGAPYGVHYAVATWVPSG